VAAAVSTTPSGALGIAALVAWLVTAGIGAAMLAALISWGDLRQQRTVRGGLPPAYLVGHFSLALTGLAVWISYLAAGWTALAWTAVGILILAIGLGISTVTLWTPFPGSRGTAAAGRSGGAGDAHSVQETPPASAEDAPARKVSARRPAGRSGHRRHSRGADSGTEETRQALGSPGPGRARPSSHGHFHPCSGNRGERKLSSHQPPATSHEPRAGRRGEREQ